MNHATSHPGIERGSAARGAAAPAQRGFTLVEVAISLILLALAAVGVFSVLTQQIEQHRISDTNDTLAKASDALLSFVTANGYLPCPAIAASNGVESVASVVGSVRTCTVEAGFLPAVTLGMSGLDANGLLDSAWRDNAGAANGTHLRAIRYAVTGLSGTTAHALTSAALGAPGSTTQRTAVQIALTAGAAPNQNQGLFVCASVTGIQATGNRCNTAANTVMANVPVVIWSLGSNAANVGGYSPDERQNYLVSVPPYAAVPRVFINRPYAPQGAANTQFDDQVAWISYSLIADRLVYAGFVQ